MRGHRLDLEEPEDVIAQVAQQLSTAGEHGVSVSEIRGPSGRANDGISSDQLDTFDNVPIEIWFDESPPEGALIERQERQGVLRHRRQIRLTVRLCLDRRGQAYGVRRDGSDPRDIHEVGVARGIHGSEHAEHRRNRPHDPSEHLFMVRSTGEIEGHLSPL